MMGVFLRGLAMGLFSTTPKVEQLPTADFSQQFSVYSRRLWYVEKAHEAVLSNLNHLEVKLEKRRGVLEQEMQQLRNHLQDVSSDIQELKHLLANLVTNLQHYAKHEEIEKLKTYVEAISPLEYVRREEITALLDEML
ncbi:MAG: hypothetical protein QW594_01920 [Candidatus Woesearchaeota archaeon]